MSLDTLAHVFHWLHAGPSLSPTIGVVWHAGEPLVVPPTFYEQAFRVVEGSRHGRRVTHAIQTNGTLITGEWCDLFRAHDVQIGVSLDGPASIHDRHRLTRRGRGTHDRVMRGIELLQRHEIPFHVIAVLTRDALECPDEIYEFFRAQGIRQIGFNVEEMEGVHAVSSLCRDRNDSDLAYRRFMSRLYALVRGDSAGIVIREFERARAAIVGDGGKRGRPATAINHQASPFEIVSVDCDGNVSTFSPELLGQKNSRYADFIFGNVARDAFCDVSAAPAFKAVLDDVAAGVAMCRRRCEYFGVCGGGAPANKYFENGSFESTETMYCRYSIQVPIDIVLEDLERSLLSR